MQLSSKGNFFKWLIVCGIFAHRFELVCLILFLIYVIGNYKDIIASPKIILSFFILFIFSIISIYILKYDYDFFFSQYAALLFYFSIYFIFFEKNKSNIQDIFQKYLFISGLVSVLGILQFIVFFLYGFNIFHFINKATFFEGTNIIRISSITTEPSNLGTLILPAVCYHLFTYDFLDRTKSITKRILYLSTFVAIILTFSSIVYFILIFVVINRYFLYKKKLLFRLIAFCTMVILVFFFYNKSINRQDYSKFGVLSGTIIKIDQTIKLLEVSTYNELEGINSSSFATLINFNVAKNSPSRILGTGLGTHYQNYESLYPSSQGFNIQNSKDAYSLGTRIFSEFGYFGVLLFVFFLIKNFNKHSIISISVLFLLISHFIRGGNYILYGLIFFLFLYYYTKKSTVQKSG